MPRPRKQKLLPLDNIVKRDWDTILSQVEKKEIPIELLESVLVNFIDGSQIEIKITELLEEGMDPSQLEHRLNARLETLDELIHDIDFHITKEKIIYVVDEHTQELLKKIGKV